MSLAQKGRRCLTRGHYQPCPYRQSSDLRRTERAGWESEGAINNDNFLSEMILSFLMRQRT